MKNEFLAMIETDSCKQVYALMEEIGVLYVLSSTVSFITCLQILVLYYHSKMHASIKMV